MEQSGHYESKRNVRKLITLGTPHLGSPSASMVTEVFKKGIIANATANDLGANAATMWWAVTHSPGLFTQTRNPAGDIIPGKLQESYLTLAINSPNLKKLAGTMGSGPFSDDVAYAAISGSDPVISGLNLNTSFRPMDTTFGANASFFPWIDTMQGTNDGVVPDWSSQLGVASHNRTFPSNHTGLVIADPAALVQFTQWLNGSNGSPRGYVQVPLGSTQRVEYLKPRTAANTSDPKNQPPEWARFAYDSNGKGLNRDAIIKVELDTTDTGPFYGTQNINWGTDPADNDLGVHSVKVTGMMNKSSIGTAQVRLWSNSGLNALLDNGGAVPAAERGSDPVNPIIVVSPSTNTNPADDPLVPIAVNMRLGISAKTSLGRVYTQLSGPRGDSGNLTSSTYTVHATVLNGPANSAAHVPGWSFQPSFPGVSIGFVDYSPGTSVVIPAYRLPSPSVNGLTLTLNGAIPLGSGGVPGTDTLKLYEDITIGTSNLEIHSVVVTSITVSGGWAGLMAPYSQVVTLTRTTSNKILGNVNNTWRASAKIFQRIFELGFSSDSTQVD